MKKITLLITTILFVGFSIPALAQVRFEVTAPPPPTVRVAVPLPPPIPFPAPPEVVVLPETEVYVVPSVTEEIFFYNGYWWRPWNGRWYRSLRYDRGWGVFAGVPGWYGGIPHDWRDNYRHHLWGGHPWNYHHISHNDLHRNWRTWHNTGHWNRPEHRQFTHRHDGRVYTGHVDRGQVQGHVNKGAIGAGQGHVNKGAGTGQSLVNKGATQGNVNKGVTQTNVNKGAVGTGQGRVITGTAQGNINKAGTAAGQGHVGTGGHGATGTRNLGQATKGQN